MQRGRAWHSCGYVVPDSDTSHPVGGGSGEVGVGGDARDTLWQYGNVAMLPFANVAMWQNCQMVVWHGYVQYEHFGRVV